MTDTANYEKYILVKLEILLETQGNVGFVICFARLFAILLNNFKLC